MSANDTDNTAQQNGTANGNGKTKRNTRIVMGVFVAIGCIYGLKTFISHLGHESTDNAFIEGTAVQVSPRVMGPVVRVAVKDNQHVNAGDLLLEIDPTDYQTRIDATQAALSAAEGKLRSAEAALAAMKRSAPADAERAKRIAEAADAATVIARAQLASAQSMLAQAHAHRDAARAAVEAATAEAEAAEAEANRSKADFQRYEKIFQTGGITESQLDQFSTISRAAAATLRAIQRRVVAATAQSAETDAAIKVAEQAVRQAESQIKQADAQAAEAHAAVIASDVAAERIAISQAQRDRAEAAVKQWTAQLTQAKLDLSYTRLVAAQAGTITKKSVDVGNFVRPGQPLLAIVSDEKWVVANFKETQLESIRPGQSVDIRIDAYPSLRLTGHVDSIQRGTGARFSLLPAENATGNYVKIVQRVPVKIIFDAPPPADVTLSLGMSVIPSVNLKSGK